MTIKRRIYVVDDDEALRQSVQALLEAVGDFSIAPFSSGDAFLSVAQDLDPGCVLLDINMPGKSGIEVLHLLREADARFEIILLTGQGDIALAVEAMKGGAADFIEKPYDNRTLMDAIEVAFARLEDRVKEASVVHAARDHIDRLTPRERDVLVGLIDGKANKIIAYELDISPRTVEIYRANLMDKLEVRSVAEAVRIAFAAGLVPLVPPSQ